MILSELFNDLSKIDDIFAVFLYGKTNNIIDKWIKSDYNETLFTEIGLHFNQVFTILNNSDNIYPEVNVAHEKGQIYVYQQQDLMLIVVCKQKVDASLLRLIINVGFFRFSQSKKIQKFLKKLPQVSINFIAKEYLDDAEQNFLKNIRRYSEK